MKYWRNIIIFIYYFLLIGIPYKLVEYYKENNIPFTIWHLVLVIIMCIFLLWLGLKIHKTTKNK